MTTKSFETLIAEAGELGEEGIRALTFALESVAAEKENQRRMIASVTAEAARLGVRINDHGRIDPVLLTAALRASGMSIENRIATRHRFAKAGLID